MGYTLGVWVTKNQPREVPCEFFKLMTIFLFRKRVKNENSLFYKDDEVSKPVCLLNPAPKKCKILITTQLCLNSAILQNLSLVHSVKCSFSHDSDPPPTGFVLIRDRGSFFKKKKKWINLSKDGYFMQ